ncbi:MAG: 50S ribosomal protein L10 [Candidatus Margulisbacteria bacterium]|nr:50S ribosomal protein L10 [Candidatus Margulisiibacteriota bacterium]MBU1021037.1 50S ribosomal protein L10 [Candidatus Margulisiibacteriota bacterium]MBU1729712.1 50S ribosomal protein L10 [Candidatus Margulisiibacteriota bacterium]MBU1955977.1 50S ribosomal protein L10 [Candidatus Margulisiibacteriota bacterium]
MEVAKREPRPKKVKEVQALKEKLEKSVTCVVTDYKGMSVAQISELRKKLRESQVEYKVVKNTLFLRALKEAGISGLDEHITGPVAVAFSNVDPVSPAKVLIDYFEENEKPLVKAGIVEEKLADIKLLTHLAQLPSRDELIAKVVGGIKGPLQGLVLVLSGLPRKLVYALNEIKNKKGGE